MSPRGRKQIDKVGPEKQERRLAQEVNLTEGDEEKDFQSLPVGLLLRAVRQQKKLQIEEVAAELKIRQDYLIALEEDDVNHLPEWAYTIGFVRSYANYLGLEGAKVVKQYKAEQQEQRGTYPSLDLPTPIMAHRNPNKIVLWVTGGLFCLLLFAGGYWLSFQTPRKTNVSALPSPTIKANQQEAGQALSTPVPPSSQTSPVAFPSPSPEKTTQVNIQQNDAKEEAKSIISSSPLEVPASSQASLLPPAQPNSEVAAQSSIQQNEAKEETREITDKAFPSMISPSDLVLTAQQESWVRITNQAGEIQQDRLLKAGEKIVLSETQGYHLMTGNAGGIILEINGRRLPSLGKVGEVKRHISLDPSYLLEQTKWYSQPTP